MNSYYKDTIRFAWKIDQKVMRSPKRYRIRLLIRLLETKKNVLKNHNANSFFSLVQYTRSYIHPHGLQSTTTAPLSEAVNHTRHFSFNRHCFHIRENIQRTLNSFSNICIIEIYRHCMHYYFDLHNTEIPELSWCFWRFLWRVHL